MDSLTITVVHRPDRELAAALAGLVERVAADAGPAVGERKRVQLHRLDDAPWTAVVAGDGGAAPQAYAHVRWERPERCGLVASVEVAVDGGDDALADRLLAAAREVIAEAGGGRWQIWAHHPVAARAAERAGLALTRRLLLMHARLAGDAGAGIAPSVALPEGVTLAPLREGRDEGALIEVNNAAFAAHPEQGGWTTTDLAARRAADWYDPADVLLAWSGRDLLGFHWTKRHPDGQRELDFAERLGEVYVLAVHPRAQGMGLGRALLRAGVAHLADRGCTDVTLYVDADEPAVQLYRGEGFATRRIHHCYIGQEPSSDVASAAT